MAIFGSGRISYISTPNFGPISMKLGKKWEWVQPLLKELNLIKKSIFAERIGFSDLF